MEIQHDVSLKPYNTFGIEAWAKDFVAIRSHEDLMQLLHEGWLQKEPFIILGGGSNVVFTRNFDGMVVHMENASVRFGKMGNDIVVAAEAGMVMDQLVHQCAERGAHGLENLAAIPGTVGASAVQNVGAYGTEAKDCILCVQAYEIATGNPRTFMNEECGFGYRQSVFKGALKDKYIIESVMYRLSPEYRPQLGYKALADAIAAKMQSSGSTPDAMTVIDTITQVRWAKLPRPEEKGSAGSFFKNPVVPMSRYESLKERFPELVAFEAEAGKMKLSAGWMIEHSGWKGRNLGHAGVYEKQALVLVNADGEARGQDVVELAGAVVSDVYQKFGVLLTPEAIII